MLEFPLPIVAAVNGPAIAGGFDLAVMCDLRIASETATFSHPEVTFGDVVYAPLHDLVGGAVARDLCFTGRKVDATEALALHLVTAVVAPESSPDRGRRSRRRSPGCRASSSCSTKAKASRRAGITVEGTLDL